MKKKLKIEKHKGKNTIKITKTPRAKLKKKEEMPERFLNFMKLSLLLMKKCKKI
jgi:hypothetical protein